MQPPNRYSYSIVVTEEAARPPTYLHINPHQEAQLFLKKLQANAHFEVREQLGDLLEEYEGNLPRQLIGAMKCITSVSEIEKIKVLLAKILPRETDLEVFISQTTDEMNNDPVVFLKAMAKKPAFTQEEKSLISDLLAQFDGDVAPSLLALFITDIVTPAILNQERAAAFEEVYNDAERVLSLFLPEGTQVDEFISLEASQTAKELREYKTTQAAHALLQSSLPEIAGDNVNQQIEDNFENNKRNLLQAACTMEKQSQRLHAQRERIQLVKKECEAVAEQVQEHGLSHKEIIAKQKHLLQKNNELLSSIRH